MMYGKSLSRLLVPILVLMFYCAISAGDSYAQTPDALEAGRFQLTRAELQRLLLEFEQTERSPERADQFRLRAQQEAELVRARLRDGDFQAGDQVQVSIEGEEGMPLTLTVAPGRTITLPSLGEVSLAGVLRSELHDTVREFVSKLIQSPVVQTRSLIRIAVIGQVGRPGFFALPAESLVSDAIMAAGGPTNQAELKKARVERGLERIWEGKVLQQAVSEGRTLDQMSLRSGDQLVVPAASGPWSAGLIRWVTVIPAALLAIAGLRAM
jgi:hypothetical protein